MFVVTILLQNNTQKTRVVGVMVTDGQVASYALIIRPLEHPPNLQGWVLNQ
jgi:hypothetical protein